MTGEKAKAAWPPLSDDQYHRQVVEAVGADLADRLAEIDLLVFDADGVMTDGALYYGPEGETLKQFHSQDGLGLVMARLGGLKRAVLTGRNSVIVQRRCRELQFDVVKLGRFDKCEALEEILTETECVAARTLYMGDDLIDLPAMQQVAVAVTVPAAPPEVKACSVWTTVRDGGHGAVRDVTDLVLKAAGRYGTALRKLTRKEARPQ